MARMNTLCFTSSLLSSYIIYGIALTNKKRKMLDTANKKRNTAACFEVGYVSSSFLHGAVLW